jgi:hypothetical protein
LRDEAVHILRVDSDISHILELWDYVPGQVVVRRFVGKDGREKIQLRVDLGLLQMNVNGRPDGKRPFGHPSLLEFHEAKLKQHRAQHDGDDERFSLKAEDCARLQMEAIQYHHRYICLLQLEDFAAALRDTARNLRVLDFVARYAASEDMAWSLDQFRPQLLLIDTRARASRSLKNNDYPAAIHHVEAGLERIRQFYQDHGRMDLLEHRAELRALEEWRDDLNRDRPLTAREKLELDLSEALKREDYETAARVRDQLRELEALE